MIVLDSDYENGFDRGALKTIALSAIDSSVWLRAKNFSLPNVIHASRDGLCDAYFV